MTQTEKDLKDILLKDLCGRLPHGVKIQTDYTDTKTLEGIQFPDYIGISDGYYSLEDMECKPYLFPLSSMTEEQRKIYHELIRGIFMTSSLINFEVLTDFFNRNHLDYRGLIPMGLAIDATGLNIY